MRARFCTNMSTCGVSTAAVVSAGSGIASPNALIPARSITSTGSTCVYVWGVRGSKGGGGMCERHASLRVCACARVRVRWEEAKRCRDCQQWQVSFQDTQASFTGYTGLFCRVRRSLFRHMHTSVSISLRRVAKDVRPSSCIQSCSPDSHKHRVVQNVDDDEDNSKSQSLVLTLRKSRVRVHWSDPLF